MEQPGYFTSDEKPTWQYSQDEIAEAVDLNSANKIFSLELPEFGPYVFKYSNDGNFILLGGRKGHVAHFNWKTSNLLCELHLKETVRDVTYLHNETMFTVAQKKEAHIYDQAGVEIHRIKEHSFPHKLDFLPYHFLLVTTDNLGTIRWQDTSTGQMIASHSHTNGIAHALVQNRTNAIMFTGHQNGSVALWSPSVKEPVVKLLAHTGAVNDVAVSFDGLYCATAGIDNSLKIWDIRMFKEIRKTHTFKNVRSLDWSQTGLLASASEDTVSIWKLGELYMQHRVPKARRTKTPTGSTQFPSIERVRFCPYEDFLGISTIYGFSSVAIPGAGEANFDSREANPYQTRKQRREKTVVKLLDKIPPELITLNPNEITNISGLGKEYEQKKREMDFKRRYPGKDYLSSRQRKGKKAPTVEAKKQKAVIDAKSAEFEEQRIEETMIEEERRRKLKELPPEPEDALQRFRKT
uniref:BING4 C-terminal domain-containing protein n=1 Tax=Arcella intermedia TaxID=1963864 RepID=A0A6B2L227_9EUKA